MSIRAMLLTSLAIEGDGIVQNLEMAPVSDSDATSNVTVRSADNMPQATPASC